MSSLKLVAPTKGPEKLTQTRVDTILVTPKILEEWLVPPFQRPVRVNAKVVALSEELKRDGGVFPGILTIGVLKGKHFIVDGQHRIEAFKISALKEGYSDVRYRHYESLEEMGEDFVRLNSQLVRLRPDDVLRGLEGSHDGLKLIRHQCPFVGYDMIRRGPRSPIVSMSAVVRNWLSSIRDVPSSAGHSAMSAAHALTVDEAAKCIEFLQLADRAWGRDPEYGRLWGALNMTLCMWLYRRTVITLYTPKTPKLTRDLFAKCMATLSTNGDYLDWLYGRPLTERDRSPAYSRIKKAFARRLEQEWGKKVGMPSPEWAHD